MRWKINENLTNEPIGPPPGGPGAAHNPPSMLSVGMQIKEMPPECFEFRFVVMRLGDTPAELNDMARDGWVPCEHRYLEKSEKVGDVEVGGCDVLVTMRREKEQFRGALLLQTGE